MCPTPAKEMTTAQKKVVFADKYKELALDLQKFFDDLPQNLYDTEACEALVNLQSECCNGYEELTGKSVF